MLHAVYLKYAKYDTVSNMTRSVNKTEHN